MALDGRGVKGDAAFNDCSKTLQVEVGAAPDAMTLAILRCAPRVNATRLALDPP